MSSLQKFYTKKDVQNKFNISLATVNNWIKTGNIPAPEKGLYTQEIFNHLVNKVELESNKLQSRVNRLYKNTSQINFLNIKDSKRKKLLIQLVDRYISGNLSISEAVAYLGKQILISNELYKENSDIFKTLNKNFDKTNIFQDIFIKNENDDILGAFYQCIQSIANKSKNGSFYTPSKLLSSINIPLNAKVLDPCCGSGGILINTLSKKHNPKNIYAFDTDETALLICKINLILFFNNAFIYPNIEYHDLIFGENQNLCIKEKFEFIITNPPWGSKLSKEQKENLLNKYPTLYTTEVFSIALYNSIHMLDKNGHLYFFLPEAILNVSAHKNIRKFLLQLNRNIEIVPLGKAFKGVQSECILLKLSKKSKNKFQLSVKKDKVFYIDKKDISAPDYLISYNVSDKDYKLLNKIYSCPCIKLPATTKFALGIVTGNNKKYLHNIKQFNDVPIFKGKDILPYKLKNPEMFIKFTPEVFQQVAPIELYYSKKIIYKFISNKIVCALDNGNLVLNSANIIISKDYSMEILTALYNSPIYSFIYQKKFKSKKLLKQHFQDFPLPILNEELKNIFLLLYNDIIKGLKQQEDIDKKICEYFNITQNEYFYIKEITNRYT